MNKEVLCVVVPDSLLSLGTTPACDIGVPLRNHAGDGLRSGLHHQSPHRAGDFASSRFEKGSGDYGSYYCRQAAATSHGRLASASLVFGPSHPPLWPAAAAISGHSRSLRSFSSDTDHPINAKNDKNGFPASSDEGIGHGNFKQQVAASPSLLDLLDEQVEHGGGESEADDGSCNNQNQRAHPIQ